MIGCEICKKNRIHHKRNSKYWKEKYKCMLYWVQYNLSIEHIWILVVSKILTFIMVATTSVPPIRADSDTSYSGWRPERGATQDTLSPVTCGDAWRLLSLTWSASYLSDKSLKTVDDESNLMCNICNLLAIVFKGEGGCTPCRRGCSWCCPRFCLPGSPMISPRASSVSMEKPSMIKLFSVISSPLPQNC